MASLETNVKILIGSVIQNIDKKLIYGDDFAYDSITLLNLLVDALEYALAQYNAGNTDYDEKIRALNVQLHNLKSKCPEICIYRDRLIVSKPNTAPTIQNNSIILCTSNLPQLLPYNEVIKDYADVEGHLISQVVVLSVDASQNVFIDNNPVIINNIYQPNGVFTAQLAGTGNNVFLFQNGVCPTANIIEIDPDDIPAGYEVSDIHTAGFTTYQKITSQLQDVANDTIIYVHIGDTDVQASTKANIQTGVLAWWNNYILNVNPTFSGSLVITDVPNSSIDNNYAVGRGGVGQATIIAATSLDGGTPDSWLETPTVGLLKQAWKEGEADFADEAAFKTWINGKNLITITYVTQNPDEYHGDNVTSATNAVNFNSEFGGTAVNQMTPEYITDYTDFWITIAGQLNSFQGFLRPTQSSSAINNTTQLGDENFMLHAIAAIEGGALLTQTEVDTYINVNYQLLAASLKTAYFYNNLTLTTNIYTAAPLLQSRGWSLLGLSGGIGNETDETFYEALESDLTDTQETVMVIDEIQVASTNQGVTILSTLTLKVRDNDPYNPLFSNVATIGVSYDGCCEDTPQCEATPEVEVKHHDTYTFQASDFTTEVGVDKVSITDISSFTNGTLEYYGTTITGGMLPLIILLVDIGNLVYVPDGLTDISNQDSFSYVLAFEDIINYCPGVSTMTVIKLSNPNSAAVIDDKGTTARLYDYTAPETFTNETIDVDVFYTGEGGYKIFWEQTSGAADCIMRTVNEANLDVENLKAGAYGFTITVITDIDKYETTITMDVTVTALP